MSEPGLAPALIRPEITAMLTRGVARAMIQRGYSPLAELTVSTGRRIDIAALGPQGEIVAIEIKSGLADFRADQKWHEYFDWCDKLYFAVPADFPQEVLPAEPGLIVADGYGGEIVRETIARPLNAARRKAMLIRYARIAAERLARGLDPAALM